MPGVGRCGFGSGESFPRRIPSLMYCSSRASVSSARSTPCSSLEQRQYRAAPDLHHRRRARDLIVNTSITTGQQHRSR
jgi:hypothetical protein